MRGGYGLHVAADPYKEVGQLVLVCVRDREIESR